MRSNHLQEIKLEIELKQNEIKTNTDITRKLKFTGNLTEEQWTRLPAVANACPVYKILGNLIEINTSQIWFPESGKFKIPDRLNDHGKHPG